MKITVLDKNTLGEDTPFNKIEAIGEVTYYDFTPKELIAQRIKDSEVVIVNKVKLSRDEIAAASKLKLICVFATGYDNIDLIAAREYSVGVCNVPGYSTDSVAMYTVTTVLALAAHILEYNRFVTSGEYTASGMANRLVPVYHEINGKTWGIIGYGNIGRAVGKIAEAMGAKVIVNKRTPVEGVECVSVEELCLRADIITLHCPLNEQTKYLINKNMLDLMKKDAILVNAARGAVLDEQAVADAVREGRIGGFGCDVYSQEPFNEMHPYYEIMKLDNVLLTPHAAWGAYEARERCSSIIADNIISYIEGETLNRVD